MKFNAKSIIILVVLGCLTACLCGCGGGGSDEETVEITTVAEDETKEAENVSTYEAIYDDYNAKMKKATEEYSKEIKAQADSLGQDDLYDLINKKTKALEKIRKEGADKMTDQTLNNTNDDQEEYEKWFSKLTEAYSNYSRELTEIYTDRF